MNLIERFNEWLKSHAEKEEFRQHWITKHRKEFTGQTDAMDEYHCEIAWMIMTMMKDIEELKGKVK